jgi:hypothetical protein
MTDETQLRNSVIDALADQKERKLTTTSLQPIILKTGLARNPLSMTLMPYFANSGATALNL